ncbi:type VII secretion integral membrane protein EccD [Citricoccus sp. GCM10030269]|uniref:type VII secretion integral membrane protein EccD n=1 Tax=Citricoccus sp. GCM10030269 TaxID=3273388 RepID=UPI00361BEE82
MPIPYTRVSLVGVRRNADLLLPSDTPVGSLMPQILEILNDRPEESLGAKLLVRHSGETVPATQTFAEAGVLDGERLTLVSRTEAPPSPIVYDLNDEVSDATESVRGRWSAIYRYLTFGFLAAVGAWWGINRLLETYVPDEASWINLGVAAVLLITAAASSAPGRRQAVAGTLAGTGALFGVTGLVGLELPDPWVYVALAGFAALILGVLGFVVNRPLSMFIGAAVTGALTVSWTVAGPLAAWAIGDRDADQVVGAAGIAGILTVLVMGLLPKIALGASGLASMDDRHASGASVLRRDASVAIDSAHGGLVTSTVACSLSGALAVWLVSSDAQSLPFSLPMLLCLVVAIGLRGRSFPLAAERVPLYLATGVGVLALIRLATTWLPEFEALWMVVLVVLALVAGSALSIDLPDHTQAQMRRAADSIEALVLFAVIPLLIGYFGIYATLLETF